MAGLPRHCDRVDVGRGLTENFRLVPCESDGFPVERNLALPDQARQNCEMSAVWYKKVGYVRPWVGYTAPEFQGRGHATRTARALVAIARQADPTLLIAAQTLREENASTSILRKLGFRLVKYGN